MTRLGGCAECPRGLRRWRKGAEGTLGWGSREERPLQVTAKSINGKPKPNKLSAKLPDEEATCPRQRTREKEASAWTLGQTGRDPQRVRVMPLRLAFDWMPGAELSFGEWLSVDAGVGR